MKYLETVAAVILLRLNVKLRELGIEEPYEKFPAVRSYAERITEADLKYWSEAENSLEEEASHPDIQVRRYASILQLLSFDPVLRSLLDLSLALFMLPELSAVLALHLGSSLNLHLAFLMEGIESPDENEILKKAEQARLIVGIDFASSPIQYQELEPHARIIAYLSGNDSPDPLIMDSLEIFGTDILLHAPFVVPELIQSGSDFFRSGGDVLQIAGSGGRRFISKHIARELGQPLLLLAIDELTDEKPPLFEKKLRALIREAVLRQGIICLYRITDSHFLKEQKLFRPILSAGIRLILCTESPKLLLLSLHESQYRLLELPEALDYGERKALWEGLKREYLSGTDGSSFDPDDLAMRYHLNASEAARAMLSFAERGQDLKQDPDLFSRIVMQSLTATEEKVGRIVYPTIRLEDVKVSPTIREILNDVIGCVRTAHTVLEDWKLRSGYHYGTAVSLLLSGPPGTGKTMTANAIAGQLGFPLYQVSLSHIVDKYIGETEKNLEKAFLFAEKSNAILFFDEADSLFGKRSEVRDSHDKYANNEISYLLQRIEAYDGVVILATNIKGNIDPAFLRRLRYVIHFESPDAATRRAIWEGCITDDVPHEEIDLDYLAEQFSTFTGSIIKTVFLNACCLAASQDKPLSMSHLLRSIRLELEKTSTVTFSADALGKYSYLA